MCVSVGKEVESAHHRWEPGSQGPQCPGCDTESASAAVVTQASVSDWPPFMSLEQVESGSSALTLLAVRLVQLYRERR